MIILMKTFIIVVFAILLLLPTEALTQTGISVDKNGGSVVDPTKNVLDLVGAAIRRQDDLREAEERITTAKLRAQEELNDARYMHARELAAAQASKLDEIAKLRSDFDAQLATAEAHRIDAIRAVDVGAVAAANASTTKMATDLATQTRTDAEVLRNTVANSATTLRDLVASTAATALQNQQSQFAGIATLINALSSRITTLEQAGATNQGKQIFQDPAIASLITEVRSLRESRVVGQGVDSGRGDVVGWIVGGLGLMALIIGAMTAIISLLMRRSTV